MLAPNWPPEPHETGKAESPSRTDDLVERHAHHLGGGLRDDRVAAGADVGHVGLDRHDAVDCRAARAPPTSSSRLLRNAAAMPMPTSQRPSRVWPGCGLRLLQPKRSAPTRRHSMSWRCENGRSGFSGSTWVSLRMRNSIGIEAELLGHFVHRDFQRHHARRLARRAHGVALGQIEHGEPHGGHAVGAGIEQPRLADRASRARRPADCRTSSRGRWR